MRKLLALIAASFLLPAQVRVPGPGGGRSGGGGTPALVQTASCSGSGTATCTFGSGATAGNTVLVFVAQASSCTVTSTPSNTFSIQATTTDSSGQRLSGYSAGSVASGTNSIHLSCLGSPWVAVLEVSGVTNIDQSGIANGTSQVTSVTTSGSVTATTEYVVAAASVSNILPSYLAGSGYTAQVSFLSGFAEVEDKNIRTGLFGSQTANFDSGHAGSVWASVILTFK